MFGASTIRTPPVENKLLKLCFKFFFWNLNFFKKEYKDHTLRNKNKFEVTRLKVAEVLPHSHKHLLYVYVAWQFVDPTKRIHKLKEIIHIEPDEKEIYGIHNWTQKLWNILYVIWHCSLISIHVWKSQSRTTTGLP